MLKPALVLFALLGIATAAAHERVPLLSPENPTAGWTFNNGQEFKGATGGLIADPAAAREGKPSLRLHGDFTKGGKYVQAGSKIDNVEIQQLSMWVKNPGSDRFTLRLIDGSGQCHQLALKTDATDNWQQIVLPLEKFFARRGESDAVQGIAKYESWGGAKDGKWHGPATSIYILLSQTGETKTRTLWLNDVTILPKAPMALVKTRIPLNDLVDGQHDWKFTNGQEFPGAKGSLTVDGRNLKLVGDFTSGGAYVAAVKNLAALDAEDITAFLLKYKTSNADFIRVQLVDGSGQTHQTRLKISPDGKWNDLEILPSKVAGGEHWGGANDSKWHASAKMISIAVSDKSDPKAKQPVIELSEITAEATRQATLQTEAFKSDFETDLDWNTQGGVAIDPKNASDGKAALRLSRTENEAQQTTAATSPSFKASPGNWQIALSLKSDLKSPDSSYSGTVHLECLDATGKPLDRFVIADVYGAKPWTAVSKTIELPKNTATAHFVTQLNKTWGSFWIDSISAAFLAPATANDNPVSRILFSTAQLGNLLFPNDPRTLAITVEAAKPLATDQQELTCLVRDYWGAEQTEPIVIKLGTSVKEDGKFVYTASLDLTAAPLEIGKYYEVQATSAKPGSNPFSNHTSLAILPEASTKAYKPEEVPFTSRNWDNRITEYIRLTDRLGIRICGLWAGWSSKPPYKPEAPKLDLVKELGMGWLTTTPAKFIEDGKRDYDETALRQGVRNLINEFGGHRPMIINLGNEPHGTGERVKANVEAYRVLYDEIKKVDPTIPVVATSVEPNEEYFKLGYGKYCDAFDFHVYETPAGVRKNITEYQALQKKYDVVKPIWSTELGLNSQGQTRHVVAVDLIKKTASFFAQGGVNMSWFGLLYPDPDGKDHGSSGNSHNVFDCRFKRYAPRLDAVAYYNAVNAVGIKKFVAEKTYSEDIHAFLFRDLDQKSLQILWKDKGEKDAAVPLPGVGEVQLIRIDGTRALLDAGKESLTLTLGEDPIILLYQGGEALAADLAPPATSWAATPAGFPRTKSSSVNFTSATAGIELTAPTRWAVRKTSPGGFSLTPPAETAIREAVITATLSDGPRRSGQLQRRIRISD